MIEYIELRWGNCFSYGPDNKISFNDSPITQIVGKNGHGKSSIGLILEEVLFNKNSKGIKKGNILNRYSKDKQYWIELDFKKDGATYTVKVSRGSTQKVALYRDGEDISSHTATGTFQDIESLIGYDHKTFSQIVYQSSVQSLEFLTATDSNRKKFLIDLLNLGKYSNALELFKQESSELSKRVAAVSGQISTLEQWHAKYAKQDLELKQEVPVPEVDPEIAKRIAEISAAKLTVQSENKRISQNNTYKVLRDKVQLISIVGDIPSKEQLSQAVHAKAEASANLASLKAEMLKLTVVKTHCPTCGQKLDGDVEARAGHMTREKARLQDLISVASEQVTAATTLHTKLTSLANLAEQAAEKQAEYEKYHNLYDPSLPEQLIQVSDLDKESAELSATQQAQEQARAKAIETNRQVAAHNAKVESLAEQIADNSEQLSKARKEHIKLADRLNKLQVLVKAFSTTGLVAYKIECLVKDLEQLTNEYLAEMSDGRFQLSFQISGGDKLNVVITDNGQDVEILALSSGERARVNIATLLAIRKLMQSLSKTRSNLLILDETVENLDVEGKEKLIEVLLAEEGLNTFLISHGFTHPLLEKLQVVKEGGFSHIE